MYVSSSMRKIASNWGSEQRAECLLDDLTDGAICFGLAWYVSMLFDNGDEYTFNGLPPRNK